LYGALALRFGIPHNVGAPALRLALWCAAPQPWIYVKFWQTMVMGSK